MGNLQFLELSLSCCSCCTVFKRSRSFLRAFVSAPLVVFDSHLKHNDLSLAFAQTKQRDRPFQLLYVKEVQLRSNINVDIQQKIQTVYKGRWIALKVDLT